MKETVDSFFSYLPELTRRSDFDQFWTAELEISKRVPLNAEFTKLDYPITTVEAYSLWYDGTDGTRVEGLYVRPSGVSKDKKCPLICSYHGYSGNCGEPSNYLEYASLGYAVISLSCRNQGGRTYDRSVYHSGIEANVTHGILDKAEYYYKGVILDCIRLIDVACELPEIDDSLIIVTGGSQGGGLSLQVCGLDSRIKYCFCDVPSYCNIEERIRGEHGSLSAVANYIKRHPSELQEAYNTLSYYDNMNFADRITAEVFASVGTKDPVCPPKMFFAAYNRITAKKHVTCYPFCQHEGGSAVNAKAKTKNLARIISEYKK